MVAWIGEGRCGLHFNSHVSVRDWMAPGRNSEQTRVDQTVSILKAGALPLHESRREKETETATPTAPGSDQLVLDLREVCSLLDAWGAELIEDEDLVRRHGPGLQNLDIAAQTIAAVIDILISGSPAEGELADRLSNLRASRSVALKART